MCLKFCILVCLALFFSLSASQDDDITNTNADKQDKEKAVNNEDEVSLNAICSKCVCSDGLVDCKGKDIQTPFAKDDWDALNLEKIDVDLSSNPLETMTAVSDLNIRRLNLSNCKIETIAEGCFMRLVNLTSLDLSSNRITTSQINRRVFEGYIKPNEYPQPFKHLIYMNLSNNDIHSLPQDLFIFMKDIKILDLSGNPLAYIDQVTMGALTDLTNLEELRLSRCDLEVIPEGLFRRHRRLKTLDLSGNRFASIPGVLAEATNLVSLQFDKNLVEYINGTTSLSSLTKLQELSLSRLSKLKSIADGALGGLEKLAILRLSYNPKLSELGSEFLAWTDDLEVRRWPSLKELYLNHNSLGRISSGIVERWDQLSSADFSNNPYICDCRNQWMVDVLVPIMKIVNNGSVENMICKKPNELLGLSFSYLHDTSRTLVCDTTQDLTELPEPDTAIMLGVVIGVFVTFPIVLLVILLWKKGYFARCRSKFRHDKEIYDEVEVDAF